MGISIGFRITVLCLTSVCSVAEMRPFARTQQAPTVRRPLYTAQQAERGEKAYLGECSRCHADGLLGNESGPALVGSAFLTTWRQRPLSDLFELIRTTMPQDAPGRLSAADTAAIVAYMLKGNDFPDGQTPLPSDVATLKTLHLPPR